MEKSLRNNELLAKVLLKTYNLKVHQDVQQDLVPSQRNFACTFSKEQYRHCIPILAHFPRALSFFWGFPMKIKCDFLVCAIRATMHARAIILRLITLNDAGERLVTMQLFIMQFSPPFSSILSLTLPFAPHCLRSKSHPQNFALK